MKLPRIPTRKVVPLLPEEVQAIVEVIDPRYRALVVMAAGTGLRQGEAFGVTMDSVKFPERKLTVDKQLIQLRRRAPRDGEPKTAPPELAQPKTEASVRAAPISETVRYELARHMGEYPLGKWDLVFTNERGEAIRRNRFNDGPWRRAIRDAGVPAGTGFHALRHFYASALIRHGESVVTVKSNLGHATADETLGTYAHLWPHADERTMEAVELVFSTGHGEAPADISRTRGVAG